MTTNNARILVVDDNPTNLNVLIDYLDHVGFEILAAEDGQDALEQLDYIKPDLILMDVMMPELDGFETCRRLKANSDTKDIPVIFMTALTDTVDKVEGFNVGAVDYITKPFQHEEVLARLTTHLTIRDLQTTLEQRVSDRTHRLQVIADLSKKLNHLRDLDTLLADVAYELKTEFNYYHVQLYLVNRANQIVIADGAGETGRKLKETKHTITLERTIVGLAAETKSTVSSVDNPDRPVFSHSILLPNTKSELAVPIISDNRLIGVLDILSDEANFFTHEDGFMLQTIADGIAIAIDNATLLIEREETIQQLRELDLAKSQFISMMSHELRTPLNAVLGFAELLLSGLSGDVSEQAKGDIQLIHNSGQHLLALINNILDIAKIEAGLTEIEIQPLDATYIMKEVVQLTEALLRDKSVTILLDVPADLPFILADHTRLRQIMLNLVGNAAKFTSAGQITLKARPILANKQETDKDAKMIRFIVIDTGIGIPPEKQEAIFETFQQADMSDTRQYGGIGLGLTICKQLIQLHGGDIGVISEEGQGSEFYFTLPVAASSV